MGGATAGRSRTRPEAFLGESFKKRRKDGGAWPEGETKGGVLVCVSVRGECERRTGQKFSPPPKKTCRSDSAGRVQAEPFVTPHIVVRVVLRSLKVG